MSSHLIHLKALLRVVVSRAAIASLCIVSMSSCRNSVENVDIVIIGGGASGTSAAVQAARMGASVVVAEESTWLGGMLTAAGVSAIDGNYNMPAGIFGEFRERLIQHYGSAEALKTGWVSSVLFEPSVGNEIFKSMVAELPSIEVKYETILADARQEADGEWNVTLVNAEGEKTELHAKVLIDGTELGDVAKRVGVGYDIGMEPRSLTGEDVAPLEANNIIQDLTMVAVLKEYDHDVTIEKPEDYDPDEFACTAINPLCVNPTQPGRMWPVENMITYGKLPNGKYMINWPIEGNDYYLNIIEMTPRERAEALMEAKEHTLRYIYFLQTELGFNTLGLADDEFPTADRLPFIPYHRESRRIHGKVRFDLNHIMTPYDTPQPLYRTAVAVGDYPVDHHHHAYSGVDELPNLYFHPVPSFGLPLGVIIPDSVQNLLVTEKSVSVSNIVNGTTRLQPVVMQIGQAAGALAALSVLNDKPVTEVGVRDVQAAVLDAGGYLLPYLDVKLDDPAFMSYQRIGASGILRSEGRSIDWTNQTWLRVNDPLLEGDLVDFINFYNLDGVRDLVTDRPATVGLVETLLSLALDKEDFKLVDVMAQKGLVEKTNESTMTRGEYAILVDSLLNPFGRRVDFTGQFID
ncbi:MAG: FAD-dependent oxidoreductase [Clostridiales bacterium]|nr:FAD-dependent oxidoreductase [Clostridiales bacterium]